MDPSARSAAARLTTLLIVVTLFFVLPALLFLRLAGSEGSTRVAVMILALTLPATGALVLRVNPDLVPDAGTVRSLSAYEVLRLVLLAALLLGGAWWITAGITP